MLDLVAFFAQDTPAAGTGASGGDSMNMLMIMLPMILLMFWFFMLRPQQKQEDKNRKFYRLLRIMANPELQKEDPAFDAWCDEVVAAVGALG